MLRFLVICLFALLSFLSQAEDERIDPAITDPDRTYRIFVRFAGQLAGTSESYQAFREKHQATDRDTLREMVEEELRSRAAKGREATSAEVTQLEKSGGLSEVSHHWVVAGFSARANGQSAIQLSRNEAVEYVYLQRAGAPRSQNVRPKVEPAYRSTAEEWQDDTETPLQLDGITIPWNLKKLEADRAWHEFNATGKGVLIAVLDTGLQDLPALTRALWKNPDEEIDGKDNDGNGLTDDLFGWDFLTNSAQVINDRHQFHGTACAGIMVGRPEQGIITGVAPRARFMMLRGFGSLAAYEYAVENGADILSMSYMIANRPLGPWRGLYRTAHDHLACMGIVSLGGAGNFGRLPEGKQIGMPKDIPSVIAAAGITKDGNRASQSSRGPVYWNDVPFYRDYPPSAPLIKPDVTAFFGGYPTWLVPDGKRFKGEKGKPIVGPQGNSFSGPHVAGVAALMLDANPDLNFWQIRELLQSTCTDLGQPGHDTEFGAGLLNAFRAVKAAREK